MKTVVVKRMTEEEIEKYINQLKLNNDHSISMTSTQSSVIQGQCCYGFSTMPGCYAVPNC